MSAIPQGSTVFVTGLNGYIGSHIADQLLKAGYNVHGSVRSNEKGDVVKDILTKRHPKAKVTYVLVPDMGAPGAFDDAFHGCSGVAHVASDLTFGPDPTKVIPVVVEGVKNVLKAAAQTEGLKRFVLTSSSAAMTMPQPGKKFHIAASDFNDPAVKLAWELDSSDPSKGFIVYAASKTLAEQEAWKFVKEQKPEFVLNTVNPNFNMGEIMDPRQPASTGGWIRSMWQDTPDSHKRLREFTPQYMIDVQDVALLHVAALTMDDVRNERLPAFAEPLNYNVVLREMKKIDPKRDWPEEDPNQKEDLSTIDTKRSEEILARYGQKGFTSLHDSIVRMAKSTGS